jgi:hypothetical protein
VTLVVAHCVLIFSNRATLGQSRLGLPPHNAVANIVTVLALCLVALGVYVPWFATQLKFHSLAPIDLGLAVLCGLLTLVGVLIWRKAHDVFTIQK